MFLVAWCPLPTDLTNPTIFLDIGVCTNDICNTGTIVIFTCGYEHVLVGYGYITCVGYGKWNLPIPTCEGESEHTFDGRQFIKTKTHSTDNSKRKHCWRFITWSTTIIAATCVDPTPTNGQINTAAVALTNGRYHVNSTVSINCDTGYHLVGDMESVCQTSGAWYPKPAICECK